MIKTINKLIYLIYKKKQPKSNFKKGLHAEMLAKYWLRAQGLSLLEHRFKCQYGEIDLIMQDKNNIIAIEVKTRSSNFSGFLEEAITQKQLARIKNTLIYYQKIKQITTLQPRIDIITINSATKQLQHTHR